jgi:hypothetical protein
MFKYFDTSPKNMYRFEDYSGFLGCPLRNLNVVMGLCMARALADLSSKKKLTTTG